MRAETQGRQARVWRGACKNVTKAGGMWRDACKHETGDHGPSRQAIVALGRLGADALFAHLQRDPKGALQFSSSPASSYNSSKAGDCRTASPRPAQPSPAPWWRGSCGPAPPQGCTSCMGVLAENPPIHANRDILPAIGAVQWDLTLSFSCRSPCSQARTSMQGAHQASTGPPRLAQPASSAHR